MALPPPAVPLSQPSVETGLQPDAPPDDLRRLTRTGEVGGPQRSHLLPGQALAKRRGLGPPNLVQRCVPPALRADRLPVVVRLSMTRQEDPIQPISHAAKPCRTASR